MLVVVSVLGEPRRLSSGVNFFSKKKSASRAGRTKLLYSFDWATSRNVGRCFCRRQMLCFSSVACLLEVSRCELRRI